MPETRPHKRLRRQITETSVEEEDDDEVSENYDPQDNDTIYVKSQQELKASAQPISESIAMSRPRRSAASAISTAVPSTPSVTVSRSPSGSPEENRKSIRLNFKMPASKLREVTGAQQGKNVGVNSRDSFVGGEILTGPRSSRNQKKVVAYYESDDDELDEEDEVDDEDAEGEEDEEMDDFDQIGAEAEGGTDDDDVNMKDSPVPAPTTVKFKASRSQPAPRASTRGTPKSTPKQPPKPAIKISPVKPVEEKEMELDPEDDEMSEVDEDEEDVGEEEDEEEEEEDAEGDEDEDAEGEEDDEGDEMNDTTMLTTGDGEVEDEEGQDSDEGLLNADGSRASTPDYERLTKRQRGRGEDENGFLALPMEPQIKKHFTAEEHRMRRAEMARRRKNLSEKRNEEEKMTTINKLLKKQANKKRGAAPKPENLAAAAGEAGSDVEEEVAEMERPVEKANPLYVRWISGKDGIKLGVPEEWLGKKVGAIFTTGQEATRTRMVEEV